MSRVVSESLDEILGKQFPVLDYGFVRVVDYMGDDSSVVQAARVSYGAGTKTVREDSGLINYLMRNSHTTPFEMCEIKFHIKMPIFVARQWVRHRTANINEYSLRYSIAEDDFYIPEPTNINLQSSNNKQGRGDAVESEMAAYIRDRMIANGKECYDLYNEISEKGVAREIARTVLPINLYTQWYWKIDLHNLLRFLQLRADAHAQYEIRQYANIMLDIVKLWVPITYDAFVTHVMQRISFTSEEILAIKKMIKGEECENISQKRIVEIRNILGIND